MNYLALANKEFAAANYSGALELYQQAANYLGEETVWANVCLCRQRLSIPVASDRLTHHKVGTILLFTNLGLSTIDGSSVFIANVTNLFTSIAQEVHLLCIHAPGPGFLARLRSDSNLHIKHCDPDDIIATITQLDHSHSYTSIFVRAFGNTTQWFSSTYANKLMYYWSLSASPSDLDRHIYSSAKTVVFQTEELKQSTFSSLGKTNALMMPPVIQRADNSKMPSSHKSPDEVRLCYVGVLRPECYSIELLSAILTLLKHHHGVFFSLLIAKVHYSDPEQRRTLFTLIEALKAMPCVCIEERASPERCAFVVANSDISFSLWEQTPQNARQISTKLLECLAHGVHVICLRTPLYSTMLGDTYEHFITHPNQLYEETERAVLNSKRNKLRYENKYLLSHFSEEAHASRLLSHFGCCSFKLRKIHRQLFNDQFDHIYGLYITDSEKAKLNLLKERHGINLNLFKGVNGQRELQTEFLEYSSRPLDTDWEIAARKKRLTIGALGHLHSFINIAKDALAHGYRKIMIFEADALLHKRLYELNASNRPLNYKVLYFGAGKWDPNVVTHSDGRFYTPHRTTGTFAISFDRSVLEECISHWQKFVDPTDIALQAITDKYKSDCHVFVPNLIIADVSASNTTFPRSQQELATKFDWHLDDYDINCVELVQKHVDLLRIDIDCLMEGAMFRIVTADGNISMRATRLSYEIRVFCRVERIEYTNMFLKSLSFSSSASTVSAAA